MIKSVFKNHIGEWIASVILGFLEVLALSLYYRDTLGFWLKNAGNVLLFAGLWIISAVLLYLFFRLIGLLCRPRLVMGMRTEKENGEPGTGTLKFTKETGVPFTDRHPFLLSTNRHQTLPPIVRGNTGFAS